MGGNVEEWVQDEWHNDYNGAPSDGSGWCTGNCPINASDVTYNANDSTDRVVRGGDWHAIPEQLRSTDRASESPSFHFNGIGARLAR